MINNPIVNRELLTSLRTRKAVIMQVLFLLACALLLWRLWPEGGLQDIGGQYARKILSTLALGELLMVAMFAPAFTASAITSESERGSLEVLFITALKPWEIAFGKIIGSLGFMILLVITGGPVLASTLLLGGVSWTEVLVVFGILLMTAIYLGMLGLFISTIMHRSYRAIIVTYAALMVVVGAAMVAWPQAGNLLSRGGVWWQKGFYVFASISPLEAMISIVIPQSEFVPRVTGMWPVWQVFLIAAAALTCVSTFATLWKLRRPFAPPRPREKMKVIEKGFSARSLFFLIDPRKRKSMIRFWQNPVFVKERRCRPMLQGQWLLRAVFISLICSVVLSILVSFSVQTLVGEGADMIPRMVVAIAAMMVILVILIGPATSGGALCSDRESDVWELLSASPLRSWRIVTGKLYASIIPLVLISLAVLPAFAWLIFFRQDILFATLRPLAVVAMTILFVTSAGMFFSGIFSSTSVSTAWTYGVMVTLGLGSLLVLMARDIVSYRVARVVFLVNPVAAAMDAAGSEMMEGYHLMVPHLKIIGTVSVLMLLMSIYRIYQLRKPI